MDRKKRLRAAVVTAALLAFGLAAASVSALEPPTKEQLERYRLDGTLAQRIAEARAFGNHRIPPRLKARLVEKLRALSGGRPSRLDSASAETSIQAPPPAWRGMPTRGTVKVLALLISFSDYAGVTPPATFTSRLFGSGSGSPPYDSLRNFYLRSSYDQLAIEGTVLGWYQTSYARSTVSETSTGRQNLIKEALNYYEAQGHDFSQYDNDGDGMIDYFCVFWTGPHGEWASFWWGYYTWFSDGTYRLDGKRLGNYSWQWELYNYPSGNFSPSTIIHETGHALGVPDYYDYDDSVGPRGGVGNLDIMDGSGDHNCFSKFMLDWITPVVVSGGSRTVSLRASGLYPDAVLFMPGAVPGRIFDEFFMVQNRYRSGNDTGLFTGSDGLLIWHVDARLDSWGSDFLYDNSYTSHKLLRLMEADGLEQIETYNANADAGDYYKAGAVFGPTTVPDSDRYDGTPTAMGVMSITGTTTPMSLTVFSSDNAPSVAIMNLADGQTVWGTVPVQVTASDDNGVTRVELYTDGFLRQTLTASPYDFAADTTILSNGPREIRAVAYDTLFQTASASVSVNVDNLFAPQGFKATRAVNRSLLLREYVNVLTWADNIRNTSVELFRIRRIDGGTRVVVGEVPKGADGTTYRFLHRGTDPAQTYTYEIVAVGAAGREGFPATATVVR